MKKKFDYSVEAKKTYAKIQCPFMIRKKNPFNKLCKEDIFLKLTESLPQNLQLKPLYDEHKHFAPKRLNKSAIFTTSAQHCNGDPDECNRTKKRHADQE